MILQALTRLYDDLVKQNKLERPGFSSVAISYALCLDNEGEVIQIVPTLTEVTNGKKTVMRPQNIGGLPAPVKRSVDISPNFLWDNSSYIFGTDAKGKPERSLKCFEAAKELHLKILENVNTPISNAIKAYFNTWEPSFTREAPALADELDNAISGVNIIFRVNGAYPNEDPEIASAWERYFNSDDAPLERCMITGEQDVIVPTHPAIKGVAGAQSSGASLVSFDKPAFCSYGHKQNFNAPTGKKAAFAYTAALNYLLADREHVNKIGDAAVVCWAEGAEKAYQDISCAAFFGIPSDTEKEENTITEAILRDTVRNIALGLPVKELDIDPSREFYILGLSPNAARLAVRFFYRSSFRELMQNVNRHYEDLSIVKPPKAFSTIPLWAMLRETVNPNSKDKTASPVLSGSVARAIFTGNKYPAALFENIMLRIRTERNVNYEKAAIIKAYFSRNDNDGCPKEVLTVNLNEETNCVPYVLGRLFAVYERVQNIANPDINTTIRDKYFSSAMATPAAIFPIIGKLYQKHLKKLSAADAIYFDELVTDIKSKLDAELPVHLTLAEQGSFDLGYYHQKFFESKKENN